MPRPASDEAPPWESPFREAQSPRLDLDYVNNIPPRLRQGRKRRNKSIFRHSITSSCLPPARRPRPGGRGRGAGAVRAAARVLRAARRGPGAAPGGPPGPLRRLRAGAARRAAGRRRRAGAAHGPAPRARDAHARGARGAHARGARGAHAAARAAHSRVAFSAASAFRLRREDVGLVIECK